MISFSVAYLLVLSAVIATLRFFRRRRGGQLRARYFAALAMNSANQIVSDLSATIFRSRRVYWISNLYYRQCVNPPLGEFELIYLTSYHPHNIAVRSRGKVCPMPYALCPMPYALCPMPYARRVPHVAEKGYINELDSEGNCK